MYIRVKKLKNQEYAYLVENKWSRVKMAPRQRFVKYLGKIHTPSRVYEHTLQTRFNVVDNENYIRKTPFKEILKDIIAVELFNHNFYFKKFYYNDKCYVDLTNLKVYDEKLTPCVVKLNEGFICDYSLDKLFKYLPSTDDEMKIGKELASSLLNLGIKLDPAIFVLLCKKVLKEKVY